MQFYLNKKSTSMCWVHGMERNKEKIIRYAKRIVRIFYECVLYVILAYSLWCMVQQNPSEEYYSNFIAFLAFALVSARFHEFLRQRCHSKIISLVILIGMLVVVQCLIANQKNVRISFLPLF